MNWLKESRIATWWMYPEHRNTMSDGEIKRKAEKFAQLGVNTVVVFSTHQVNSKYEYHF